MAGRASARQRVSAASSKVSKGVCVGEDDVDDAVCHLELCEICMTIFSSTQTKHITATYPRVAVRSNKHVTASI